MFLLLLPFYLSAQSLASFREGNHLSNRQLRYLPDGEDFVVLNGDHKFNRSLYGGSSGFRLETGDVPEFALYLPRMGGNLSFGMINGVDSLALNDASSIECRYRPGSRIYVIKDKLTQGGVLTITALPLANADGAIWKIEGKGLPADAVLTWRFGGASDKYPGREEGMESGPEPPGYFEFKREYCAGNVFSVNGHKFGLLFGQASAGGERRLYGEFPKGAEMKTDALPVLFGKVKLQAEQYILIALEPYKLKTPLPQLYASAEAARKKSVSQITLSTPDPYLNTAAGALSVAAVALQSRQQDAGTDMRYINEIFRHFNRTGDLAYARKMWPVITRYLSQAKSAFDPDNDGLYDAYAYTGAGGKPLNGPGAVSYSTAYIYKANKQAAGMARKIGENPEPYQAEAAGILSALNSRLWMSSRGVWAEYRDAEGNQRLHECPGVWTVYHAIDSDVADPFQAYQATRYIDFEIPRIPVKAAGLKEEHNVVVSTTNWMPYLPGLNNVTPAEVMRTALAYYQSGRAEDGFRLLKGSLLDGMYLGGGPGSLGASSFYDAARGEYCRDDDAAVEAASRVIIQGLFGLNPDAINDKLLVSPGFPHSWEHAELKTPDVSLAYKREGKKERYTIRQHAAVTLKTELHLWAKGDEVSEVKVNGQPAKWQLVEFSVGDPRISITIPFGKENEVEVLWSGDEISPGMMRNASSYRAKDVFVLTTSGIAENVYDPQGVLNKAYIEKGRRLLGFIKGTNGYHTLFVQMKQGSMKWWQPVTIIVEAQETDLAACGIDNSPDCAKWWYPVTIPFRRHKEAEPTGHFTRVEEKKCEPVMMGSVFNASVSTFPAVNDSGLRAKITDGIFKTSLGVPFRSPATGKNIAFTSLAAEYPDKLSVRLNGKASRAYLLMAGSTNHLQCHIVNGTVRVQYADGSIQILELVNPQNWYPVGQDLYVDGRAFKLKTSRPYRLHFKTGLVSDNLGRDLKIKGVHGRKIDGGAGILLEMELDPKKELTSLTLETLSNDVTVGLMGVTLQR